MAQAHAQLQADNIVSQTAFEEAYQESVLQDHLAEMEELRRWNNKPNINRTRAELAPTRSTFRITLLRVLFAHWQSTI